MSDEPKRWSETGSGSSPLEAHLLRAAQTKEPPEGEAQAVWSALAGKLPSIAAAGGAAAGTAGATAAATGSGTAAGTAGAVAGGAATKALLTASATKTMVTIAAVVVTGSVLVARVRTGPPKPEPARTVMVAPAPEPPRKPASTEARAPASEPEAQPVEVEAPTAKASHAWLRPHSRPQARLETSDPAPEPAAASEPAAVPVPEVIDPKITDPSDETPEITVRAHHEHLSPKTPARPTASALREESHLLATARDRLRGNDPAGALEALELARTRYPQGALDQERRVLLVQALYANGEVEAAAREAEAFLRDFPASPLSGRVKTFLRSGER